MILQIQKVPFEGTTLMFVLHIVQLPIQLSHRFFRKFQHCPTNFNWGHMLPRHKFESWMRLIGNSNGIGSWIWQHLRNVLLAAHSLLPLIAGKPHRGKQMVKNQRNITWSRGFQATCRPCDMIQLDEFSIEKVVYQVPSRVPPQTSIIQCMRHDPCSQHIPRKHLAEALFLRCLSHSLSCGIFSIVHMHNPAKI